MLSCCQPIHSECSIIALLLQANKAAEQQAAKAAEATTAKQAQQGIPSSGETMKGQAEAAQQQHPVEEAAQAAADPHSEFAEHQAAAGTASGPAAGGTASGPTAAVNTAELSVPNGETAGHSAAASQPGSGMPASSLQSSSDHTEAAATAAGKGFLPASHLPWQPSQARHYLTWFTPPGIVHLMHHGC